MTTVHFICRGNANRSVIAEAYLKSLNLSGVSVMSSGTIADAARADNIPLIPGTISRLEKHGIARYAKRNPEQLTQARVNAGDVTVCVNQIVVNEAKEIVSLPKDVIIWDIDDYGEGKRTVAPGEDRFEKYFDYLYRQITDYVDELVRSLEPAKGQSLRDKR